MSRLRFWFASAIRNGGGCQDQGGGQGRLCGGRAQLLSRTPATRKKLYLSKTGVNTPFHPGFLPHWWCA